MRPTSKQERMDILKEVTEAARSTMEEWLPRFRMGENQDGDELKLRWQDDGTAIVEREDQVCLRVEVSVMAHVVEAVDLEPNAPADCKPYIRTWDTIPAGWFVKTPRDGYLEVVHTENVDTKGIKGEQQKVTLRLKDGRLFTAERHPKGEVACVPGRLHTVQNAALEALGVHTILSDGQPAEGAPF